MTTKAKPLPSQNELNSLLMYNPETGMLYWQYRKDARANWNARYAGKLAFTYKTTTGYYQGAINGKNALAHRVIFKMVYGYDPEEVDHIDGDRSNNRIVNLRSADKSTNQMNASKRSGCASKYKGVCFFKRDNNYSASCNRKHLGYFDNEVDAAIAYNEAAIKEFGQYAKLNAII